MLYQFTSEAVTEGHPDKLADQISDTLLDAIIAQDPTARVAIETMLTTGLVHVGGELTTTAWVDAPALIRDLLRRIGYTSSKLGLDADSCGITLAIGTQSPDIAQGVDQAHDDPAQQGAGDQGLMFGYATNETPDLMPAPIWLAHKLATKLTTVRKDGTLPYLGPDGKTQVTVTYEGHTPVGIDTVVLSTQHTDTISTAELRHDITRHVITPTLEDHGYPTANPRKLINPTGRFVIGGPQGDAGLTGRKIIVDTYGGMARHGGGAFSGKDPSKVDRSAAYAARWVAKHVVAAGIAARCELQIAYAIGVAEPVSIHVDTFGTGKTSDDIIARKIRDTFDLRPTAIIEALNLRQPIYAQTATGGHFGPAHYPWEQTPKLHHFA